MTPTLPHSYPPRVVAPRRGNFRGFGPGPSIPSSAGAVISSACCSPPAGCGVEDRPGAASLFPRASRANFVRLTINSACQPSDVNGRSILPNSFRSPVVPVPDKSMGTTDESSINRG